MCADILRKILPVFAFVSLLALGPVGHEPVAAQPSASDACAVTPAHVGGQARFVYGGQARFVYGGQSGDAAADIPASQVISAAWGEQVLAGVAHGNQPVLLLVVDDFDTPIAHGRWVTQTILDNLQVIDDIAQQRGLPEPNITVDFVDITALPLGSGIDYTAAAIANAIRNKISAYEASLANGAPVNVIVNMSFAFIPCEVQDLGFSFDNFITQWNAQFDGIGQRSINAQSSAQGPVSGVTCGEEPISGCPVDGDQGYTDFSLYQAIQQLDLSGKQFVDLFTLEEYNDLASPLDNLFNEYSDAWSLWLNGQAEGRIAQANRPPYVVAVASSGNYGDSLEAENLPLEPYAPARWSSIMAVSAPPAFNPDSKDGVSPAMVDFAQDGNVEAEGAWFDFTGGLLPGFYPVPNTPRDLPPAWAAFPGDGRYRAGTSFSTPLIATTLALQATQPEAFALCDTFAGALPLSSGNADLWNNLGFADAISCPLLDNQAEVGEVGLGDLNVKIVNAPASIPPGGSFTYGVEVTVLNTEYIGGITVDHILPTGGDVVAQVMGASRGLYSATDNTWYLGAVRELNYFGGTDSALLIVSVNVDEAAAEGSINLLATSVLDDANQENNSDAMTVSISESQIPIEIIRISPEDTTIVGTSVVPLRWQEDHIATWYRVALTDGDTQSFEQWFEGANVCVEGVCEINSPTLSEGTFTWTMQGATQVDLGPSNDTTFIVDFPELFRVYPEDGATLLGTDGAWQNFSFDQLADATWYRVWIGTLDGRQSLFEWYPADDFREQAGICDGEVCTLPADVWLTNGDYQWWITYWGPEPGFQDFNSYWHGSQFSVEFGDIDFNNDSRMPQGEVSAATTLGWDHDPNVLWYRIWLGTADYTTEELFKWFDARDICDGEICVIPLDDQGVTLTDGDYEWWMELWGPSGYEQWAINGGVRFTLSSNP